MFTLISAIYIELHRILTSTARWYQLRSTRVTYAVKVIWKLTTRGKQ